MSSETTMQLEVSVYANQLKNVAGLMKGTSDPYAVVTHIATRPGTAPTILGKTEVVKNCLSPRWAKTFPIDFEMGTPMKICVSVLDEVRKGENKSMGSAVFDVAEVMNAAGGTKAKTIGKNGGTVFMIVRKRQGSGVFRFQLKGLELKNVEGFFSKSDPFFELDRQINSPGGMTWETVLRSEFIKNNLNPQWNEGSIEMSTLCDGNMDLPLRVSVFDHEGSGKHIPMGSFKTTVKELIEAYDDKSSLFLFKNSKQTGTIMVTYAQVVGADKPKPPPPAPVAAAPAPVAAAPKPAAVAAAAAVPAAAVVAAAASRPAKYEFMDYVAGGLKFNVVVAIDFTGSNGDPRKPGTLHHIDKNSMNDYEKAISSIVGILEKYDSDKMFPVYGFGAKYHGKVEHCFQCGSSPEVKGVNGVLEAYNQVFKSGLIMSSPTVITEVLEKAAARAEDSLKAAQQKGELTYTVLLIVTDGAVSDVHGTAECLKKCSSKPLSVVMVGVGDANFKDMEFLDDLKVTGGNRDIAQFVQFNKHRESAVDLTSVTLKEIPDQVVSFFASQKIAAPRAIEAKEEDIVIEPEEEEIDLSLSFRDDGNVVVKGGGTDIKTGF